jgi:hypothetical protein
MTGSSDLDWLKELFEARLQALEKATQLAAQNMDKRLEGMNELRGQLKDQAATFLTRNEFYIQHEKLESDIRMLRESKANLEGKASQASVNTATIIAIAGLSLSLLNIILWWVIR